MSKKTVDLLTKDELDLLQEAIEQPSGADGFGDLVIADVSKQMINVLLQSDDIVLVAHKQQEEFRFPLYLVSNGYTDELKELGPPDIIDHGRLEGLEGRYWRLADPKGVKVFDQRGEVILGCVMNISTSGLYIRCSEQQFEFIDLYRQAGDHLNFYLKIPSRGFHLVFSTIVRVETISQGQKGLALNFGLDKELALILHDYIVENHDSSNELED